MRRLAILMTLALVSSGCVSGTGEARVKVDELDEMAEQTSLASREFDVTRAVFGREIRVRGLVQDAYKYAATVSLDGAPFFEEVTFDDARYLRVIDARPIRSTAADLSGTAALLSGNWVVDPAGAPPEFGAGSVNTAQREDPLVAVANPRFPIELLRPVTVLTEVRFLDHLPTYIEQATKVGEWNTDAADYLEANDKFPPYEEDGKRFDALPAAFDPGAAITGIDSLFPFFLTSAVWVKERAIARFESLFELPQPDDPRYARLFESFKPSTEGLPPSAAAQFAQQGAEFIEAIADLRIAESRTYRAPAERAVVARPRGATRIDLKRALDVLSGAQPGTVQLPDDIGSLLPEGVRP